MAKVYVVCEPMKKTIYGVRSLDLSDAAKYGEIVVLLEHNQSLLSPVPTVRELKRKLHAYSDEDYILPIGDPALIATVGIIAAQINNGKVNFLRWDRFTKGYGKISIDTSGRTL
jgi:hypothetical protein